jgi:hypothetical protein
MRQDTPTILEDVLSRGFDQSRRIGRDDSGRFCRGVHVRCSQCDAAVINNMACHERTCPNEPREESEEFADEDGFNGYGSAY